MAGAQLQNVEFDDRDGRRAHGDRGGRRRRHQPGRRARQSRRHGLRRRSCSRRSRPGSNIVNVSSLYEDLAFGGILIVALVVDGLRAERVAGACSSSRPGDSDAGSGGQALGRDRPRERAALLPAPDRCAGPAAACASARERSGVWILNAVLLVALAFTAPNFYGEANSRRSSTTPPSWASARPG